MPFRSASLSRILAAVACCLAAGSVARAELLKVSPFMSQQAAAAPTANAPLEYVGSASMEGVEQFRIVSNTPPKKVGAWLKVGERDANLGVVLKQYQRENDSVIVEQNGQTHTLSLRASKIASAGAPQILMPQLQNRPMPTNVAPNVISTVVPNPTADDEKKRLEAVAAEVARRRAAREQAAQLGQQPGGVTQPPIGTRQDLQQAQQPQVR